MTTALVQATTNQASFKCLAFVPMMTQLRQGTMHQRGQQERGINLQVPFPLIDLLVCEEMFRYAVILIDHILIWELDD